MADPDITIEEKSEGENKKNEIDNASTRDPEKDVNDKIEELAASVKEFASKIPDSISKVVERAISGKDLPLMVRINDETLRRIDQLVETGIFQNRSESTAFLISEGIKAQSALFDRIESKIQEIEKLRGELKNMIQPQPSDQ